MTPDPGFGIYDHWSHNIIYHAVRFRALSILVLDPVLLPLAYLR